MTSQELRQVVKDRFASAAESYEKFCSIQVDVARELADRLPVRKGMRVLDIGSGTGVLSAEVQRRATDLTLVGVDIAQRMSRQARARLSDLHCVTADALKLPACDASMDLVISSSSYQWTGDLVRAFREARRVLKPGGGLHVSLFGRATVQELIASLQAAGLARGRTDVFELRRLPTREEVAKALEEAGFEDVTVTSSTRKAVFQELWTLMKWLKGIGANGLAHGFFLGREFLAHADEHYRQSFASLDGGIMATFEVVSFDVKK